MTPTAPDFNYLKRLWILKSVLDTGGLSQAAAFNNVTVSAISQSLTNLEESLGRKLLIRRDRKIQPTPYCLDLLDTSEPIFSAFAQMEVQKQNTCAVPAMSWLNFGVSEHLACETLPRFMSSLNEKLPKLKLKLHIDTCDRLIKSVKRGDLCMALVTDPGSIVGVSRYEIANEHLGVFAATGAFADAGPEKIPLAVLRAPQVGYPTYYSRFLRTLPKNLQQTVTCESTEVLYAVARSGAAAAVLPHRVAHRVPGALSEIFTSTQKAHNIVMVSEKICDPLEDEFLVSELKKIFKLTE